MIEPAGRDPAGLPKHEVLLGFWAACAAALLLVVFREKYLPRKFSYDGLRIQAIAAGRLGDQGDPSYGRVADLYALVGLTGSAVVAGILGVALFAACCWLVLRRCDFTMSWPALGSLMFAIVIAGVHLGHYSKDVVVLGITALALSSDRPRRMVVLVLVMSSYAYLFRSYWFVVAALFVLFAVVLRRPGERSISGVVGTAVLGLAAAGLAYEAITGANVSSLRMLLNVDRLGSVDAATLIDTYVVGAHPVAEMANLLVTFAVLLVPVPLLFLGGLYYTSIFGLIAGFWALFLRASSVLMSDRPPQPVKGAARWHPALLAYPLAFVTTQALFEPDYGSALRHLTPVLPCMVLAIALRADRDPSREHVGRRLTQSERPA